jgi:hypothetical protein
MRLKSDDDRLVRPPHVPNNWLAKHRRFQSAWLIEGWRVRRTISEQV